MKPNDARPSGPPPTPAPDEGGGVATLTLEACDVTGTHEVTVKDVQRTVPAGALAKAIASRMSLPDDVPWTLRDDLTSVFLDDNRPIGEQIENQARVTITPKTHLG